MGLLEELDKKLMVLLRDGRTLIGFLRSVDQFANLVLHQTIERIHVGKCYGDIPRGVFVVRGENVVLLGEIDAEKTEPKDIGLTEVSLEEILEKQAVQQAEKEEADRIRVKASKSEVSHTQHKETVRTCTSIISPTTQTNVPNPSRSKSIYGITTQEIFGDNSWKMTMVGVSIYLGSVPLNRLVFVPLDREL